MGNFWKLIQLTAYSEGCVCVCVCSTILKSAVLFVKAETPLVWSLPFQDLKPLYANRCHYVPKTSQKEAEEVSLSENAFIS